MNVYRNLFIYLFIYLYILILCRIKPIYKPMKAFQAMLITIIDRVYMYVINILHISIRFLDGTEVEPHDFFTSQFTWKLCHGILLFRYHILLGSSIVLIYYSAFRTDASLCNAILRGPMSAVFWHVCTYIDRLRSARCQAPRAANHINIIIIIVIIIPWSARLLILEFRVS